MALAENIADISDFQLDDLGGSLLKVIATLAIGGGVTTLAVGGVGAATTAAGVAGAGVAAYAAAETIADSDETLIQHTAPQTMISYDDYFNSFSTTHTGGNHEGFSAPATTTAVEPMVAERTHSTTTVDPQIAKALSNYHDMKGIMQDLGFIKVEEESEFSSSHLYGCPTQAMSKPTQIRR